MSEPLTPAPIAGDPNVAACSHIQSASLWEPASQQVFPKVFP